jgi:hypothetical protein
LLDLRLASLARNRFLFGGIFAQPPCWRTRALIQSASYPRSASSIVPDFKRDRSVPASRLSCVSPAVNASRTGRPLYRPPHESCWSTRHYNILFLLPLSGPHPTWRGYWQPPPSRNDPHRRHKPAHQIGAELFKLDSGRVDDRPPLFDFGFVKSGERFRRLLLPLRDHRTEIDQAGTYRWIAERSHHT